MKGTLATLAVSALIWATANTAEAQTEHGPTDVSVELTIAGRNGTELLAQSLKRLGELSRQTAFAEALHRHEIGASDKDCLLHSRPDPSGQLFDTAICIQIWPSRDKAPYSKTFESAFLIPFKKSGIRAFPAATVTSFTYLQRQLPAQYSKTKKVFSDEERKNVTPALRSSLCDPLITFVDKKDCKVEVRPSMGFFDTEIYSTQRGYRLLLLKTMSPSLADRLRNELLQYVTARKVLADDNFQVVVRPNSQPKSEQASSPPASGSQRLSSLWGGLGTNLSELDLSASGTNQPPVTLIFDKAAAADAKSIQDWLSGLRKGVSPAGNTCRSRPANTAHSEEVGGLMFPEDIDAIMHGGAGLTARQSNAEPINGYFLSSDHLIGTAPVSGDKKWHDSDALDDGDPVIVGVIVFSLPASPTNGSIGHNLAIVLQNKRRILVVAARERAGAIDKGFSYSSTPAPTVDPTKLEDDCGIGPWPSCLGRHPRVVVVAPASLAANPPAALFSPTGYVLGASVVRLAAPGANVPVLTPCVSNSGQAGWAVREMDGSSYASPMVALVISRIIQKNQERLIDTPEAAIWRVLATSDPVAEADPSQQKRSVEYGMLNAGRALHGVTASEEGPDLAAVLYERSEGGVRTRSQAVVEPFLWNDEHSATHSADGVAGKAAIEIQPRGLFEMTEVGGKNTLPKETTIQFRRLLRIARRPDKTPEGLPLFDVYYIETNPAEHDLAYVALKRKVWLGPARHAVDAEGFCRTDRDQPGELDGDPIHQSQPACLYALRSTSGSFEPINLAHVDDIIFPLLHGNAGYVRNIRPVQIRDVVSAGSPWHTAFCEVRPRQAVWRFLVKRKLARDFNSLCPNS